MAISLTQNVGFRSSGATILVPYGSANAGGSLLTLELRVASTTGAASTVLDSAGNTWLLAVDCFNANPVNGQLWYAANAIGSTNTISVVNADLTNSLQASAQEWSGCSTASPLVAVSSHVTNAASTHTAGSISPPASSAVFIVSYAFQSAFDIPVGGRPSGYTVGNSTFTGMQMFYKIISGSTTTENPEANSSALEATANVIAAFSGGAGGVVPSAFLRRRSLTLMGVS